MIKLTAAGAATFILALAVPVASPSAADMPATHAAACRALAAPGLFAHTTVKSAHLVAANTAKGQPEYCEVSATISPVPGSRIGVVYRLPSDWNHRLLGLGGGGWAGNVRLSTAMPQLMKGYATAQTDGGHPGTNPGNSSWAMKPDRKANYVTLTDFAYRAVHDMTVLGKQVVAKYYGRHQSDAYWLGCSTGGRQGLMEAQRFPDDYNGVVSGAPVYSLRVQAAELWRTETWAAPGAAMTEAQVKMLHNAVLAKCDALDGVKDGVITDPAICHFNPGVLACKAGETSDSTCLTPAQVNAVRKSYETIHAKNGTVVVYPLGVGNETGWGIFTNITGKKHMRINMARTARDLRDAYFGNPNFDLSKFDPARDAPKMLSGRFGKMYDADNPNLRPFLAHGGKLILWHGFDDPGPSALGTIAYYEQMRTKTGPARAAAGVRLFMAPGVYHCGGGPGPDHFDMLAPLVKWVEQHKAPKRVIATKANSPVSRPLCPYPEFARYQGGNPDKAGNFVCKE